MSATRPCLLLVPEFTEVQWTIKPELEEWAEVRSYDPPGVGKEPLRGEISRDSMVRRGLKELEAAAWDRFFIVADGFGIATAVRIAEKRREDVAGLALGHAALSQRTEGERAPMNREVFAAMTQLIKTDVPSLYPLWHRPGDEGLNRRGRRRADRLPHAPRVHGAGLAGLYRR